MSMGRGRVWREGLKMRSGRECILGFVFNCFGFIFVYMYAYLMNILV